MTVTGLTQMSHPPNILLNFLGKMVQTVSPKHSENLRIIFFATSKMKIYSWQNFSKKDALVTI